MDKIAVLEHLGEEEALLEVLEPAAAGAVDVVDGRVAAAHVGGLVDADVGLPRPVLVLGVARSAVRVVQALEVLGPQDVDARRDPEPGVLVEGRLARRRPAVVARVARRLAVLPLEHLGPDPRRRRRVRVAAPVHQLQPEVDVLGLVEREAPQDEVATVEASD